MHIFDVRVYTPASEKFDIPAAFDLLHIEITWNRLINSTLAMFKMLCCLEVVSNLPSIFMYICSDSLQPQPLNRY